MTCGRPSAPAHGSLWYPQEDDQPVYGTTVVASCDDGYSLVGVTQVFCTESGRWSGDLPKCVGKRLLASHVVDRGGEGRWLGRCEEGGGEGEGGGADGARWCRRTCSCFIAGSMSSPYLFPRSRKCYKNSFVSYCIV